MTPFVLVPRQLEVASIESHAAGLEAEAHAVERGAGGTATLILTGLAAAFGLGPPLGCFSGAVLAALLG